ncbi:unnamed protein product [Aphanomyces euteiches]
MRMPDIDGIQVVRRLSSQLPLTKFILLSGYGDYAYVREAFKYGVLDYLLKPAGSAELAGQIRTAIAAIEEDARQAAMAERSRQAERLTLAARLNAHLNDVSPSGDDAGSSAGRAMTEAYFIHAKAVVALFHVSDSYFNASDLALVESTLERHSQSAQLSDRFKLFVFHDSSGSICAVLSFTDAAAPNASTSLLENTVKALRENGAHQAMASVSGQGQPAELRKLYEHARLAISYRILRQPCEVLEWRPDMPSGGWEGQLPARKDIEELRLAVDTLQLERIDIWIDRQLPESLIGTNSLEQIDTVYELLLTEIRRRFNGHLPSDRSQPVRVLASFHTLSDLRRYLKEYAGIAKQTAGENAEPEVTVISFAESYIREHFNRDIQLAEMANRVSMNYSYFSSLFKERTGLTFTAYLIKVRMEEARKLLQDPTWRINEVSDRVGYSNPYHFSRAFKNYFGISPKEYRRTR